MPTSSSRTTTIVCTRRRVVRSGISTGPLPLAEGSPDTPGTLPARQALQALQAAVDPDHERLGQRLAAPDHPDQERPGEQVGDVMLAQVDEGEAERAGVAPAERALDLPGLAQ